MIFQNDTYKGLLEAERLFTASANQKNSQAQYLPARLYLSEVDFQGCGESNLWLW